MAMASSGVTSQLCSAIVVLQCDPDWRAVETAPKGGLQAATKSAFADWDQAKLSVEATTSQNLSWFPGALYQKLNYTRRRVLLRALREKEKESPSRSANCWKRA